MSIGIILASHGEFAKAALGSAEMIAGKQKDVHALALRVDETLEDMEKEITEAYEDLKKRCDAVVALCDIYGGSPFNAISRCILKGMDMIAYTGLNLPLVIDLLLSRDLDVSKIEEHIVTVYEQGCKPIKVSFADEQEENIKDL